METKMISGSKNVLANGLMVIFIGLYIALTPFDYMRDIGAFSYATKIAVLGLIIFFVFDNLLSNKAKIKLKMIQKDTKKVSTLIFLFFIYMCLTMLISNVEMSKTIDILSIFVQSLVFIFIVLNINLEKKDIRRIENIWLILTGIFGILMTAFNITNEDRFALKFFNGLIDPNFYCATLLGPFLIGISRVMDKNVGKKRIGIALLLINMVLMIMLSGSRGCLIGILVELLLYLFIYYRSQHKIRKLFKVILVFLFLVILLIPFIPEGTLERYSTDGIFDNLGSGRIDIWKAAINYFGESSVNLKVLGNGIGTFSYTAGKIVQFQASGLDGENRVSHNILFTILIEGGIVGLVLMFLLLKEILVKVYKCDKGAFCIVIGMFVAGMSIDIIYLRIFWAVIGYAIIHIKSYDMGEKNEEESQHSSTSI